MSFMNWIVSKAFGVPTINKNCYDNVLVFLTKKGINEPTFSFIKAELSGTNQNFNNRVYFGTGHKAGQKIAFLLDVNEDIPRPQGAIVDLSRIAQVKNSYSEWLWLPDYACGSFYGFALHAIGGKIETLDAIYST